MKIRLLPTTFDEIGCATQEQHLSCLIVDDCVAIDAGSLATGINASQRDKIRDIVLTHAHLDHVAGLPLFIDDLFATLKEPVCVHSTAEVAQILEDNLFNWALYPRFSELKNAYGKVLFYETFKTGQTFSAAHLDFQAVDVNHKVPSVGFIVSDSKTKIAVSGDTAEIDDFWQLLNDQKQLDALLIECAFPDNLEALAHSSHHLTPHRLMTELAKLNHENCQIFVYNIKPRYREQIVEELKNLKIKNLKILEIGKDYQF